jgi:hypothetical protein
LLGLGRGRHDGSPFLGFLERYIFRTVVWGLKVEDS